MGFGQSWRLFIRALKLSYDHIGKVMLFNLAWFVLGFAPFLAFTYLPLQHNMFFVVTTIVTLFTLGGATAAVHHVFNLVLAGEDTSLKDFWAGFKKFLVRGTLLVFIAVLGFTILTFNIWFSANYPSTMFVILSGFWIWGIIYWFTMQQFVFPFVTNQKIGFVLAIKRAALLTLDNPLASAILTVLSVVVIALSVLLAAPILIFLASFLAILQNLYYHEMMLKYERTQEGEAAEEESRED